MAATTESPAGSATQQLSAWTFAKDVHYADSSGADLRFDLYQPPSLAALPRSHPSDSPGVPHPVVIWVPPTGLEEFVPGANSVSVDSKFPTPIASYLGHGYAVAAASYANQVSKDKDLRLLLDHLDAHAVDYRIDPDHVALLYATLQGYRVHVARRNGGPAHVDDLILPIAGDDDYRQLTTPVSRRAVVEYLARHIGGAFDPAFEPMDLQSPEVAWVDLIMETHELGQYRIFPTPRRGKGTYGSYALYLPPEYRSYPSRRFPVIYFLHGGGGNQREARNWMMPVFDRLIQEKKLPPTIVVSVQALPVGWYVNGNQGADGVLSGPVEDVIMQDLIPHVDMTYRTMARREGRGLEGFSAGGFGALRLAFKFPEVFCATSSLAGAVIDYEEEPNPGFIAHTFGPPADSETRAYFDAVRPQHFAEQNAVSIAAQGVSVRLVVGDRDWLFDKNGEPITERMSNWLARNGIKNEYLILPGVDHMITQAFASGHCEYPWEFWSNALTGLAEV